MHIVIGRRKTREILISGDYESLKDCVEQNRQNLEGADLLNSSLTGVDLTGAKLRDVDLAGSDLREVDFEDADLTDADLFIVDLTGANLTNACIKGAYLRDAIGNNKEVKNINGLDYRIVYTRDFLQIGCEGHLIKNWKIFNDRKIEIMDDEALEWWTENKEFIFKTIENDPAI